MILKIFFRSLFLYILNEYISNIPFHFIRLFFYRIGYSIGSDTSILMHVQFRGMRIQIGSNCVVNQHCMLDGRGGKITIGDNVDIAPFARLWTLEHLVNSENHEVIGGDIKIGNNVWVSSGVTILPGIDVADGCVLCSGAIITKNTETNGVYAGNPAILKSHRKPTKIKNYYFPLFE